MDYIVLRNVKRIIRDEHTLAITNNVRNGTIDIDSQFSKANGDTMLHLAIKSRKWTVVTLLLNVLNASINIRNYKGETAFFYACKFGLINLVRDILYSRANVNSYIEIPDNYGMTPFLIACRNFNTVISIMLIEKGANYNHVSSSGYYFAFPYNDERYMNAVLNSGTLSTSPLTNNRANRINTNFTIRSNEQVLHPNITIRKKKEKATVEIQNHVKNEYIDMLVELKKTCNICLEPYEKNKVIMFDKCQHTVCSNCFPKLKICHMCREEI